MHHEGNRLMSYDTAQSMKPRPWRALTALFLAALAVRLLVFVLIAHEPRKFYTYDSDGYDRRAMNLLRYGQFASEAEPPLTPDLDRTPVYPLYLAAVWGVLGHQPWAAILLQLVLGSLTAAAVFLLARELRLPPVAGFVAGLIVALDPVSAMNANRLLTETLFTLLVVVGVWLLVLGWTAERADAREAAESRTSPSAFSAFSAILAAVVLALAALTRPISQFLPLVLLPLFVVMARRAGWRRALVSAALFLVVSMGLTYTWAARNYVQTGLFTLSTISDTNLVYYRARAVLADVERISQDEAWARLEAQVNAAAPPGVASPAELVTVQRRIALEIFREHPVETLAMLAKGAGRILADPGYTITCTLLDPTTTAFDCFPGRSSMNEPGLLGQAAARVGEMRPPQVFALAWSTILLAALYAAACAGAWGLVRERRWLALALLALLIAYFIGLAAGAEANSRFRLPALPFIALVAGYGMHLLLRAMRWRRGEQGFESTKQGFGGAAHDEHAVLQARAERGFGGAAPEEKSFFRIR
jgi:4-amino-4-deoxy-L-arabinose transferase-like glycosyltransferase